METQEQSSHRKDILIGLGGLLLITLFILTTNPASLSVMLLLVLPILVGVTSFTLCKFSLRLLTSISANYSKIISLTVATGLTLIVMLGSLGQLGFQDFILASLLIGGIVFYVRRSQTVRNY